MSGQLHKEESRMASKSQISKSDELACSICGEIIKTVDYADHVEKEHSKPTPKAQQVMHQTMTGKISGSDYTGGQYLKGEDVPENTPVVQFKIERFVVDPGGRS